MKLNYMQVEPAAPSAYAVFSPHGYQVALVQLPLDHNVMADYKAMEIICKALALRYRFMEPTGKSTYHS